MSRWALDYTREGTNGESALRVVVTDTTTGSAMEPVQVTRTTLHKDAERLAGLMQGANTADVERELNQALTQNDAADDVLDKRDPLSTARRFVRDHHSHPDHPTILCANDQLYAFDGICYQPIVETASRKTIYEYLEKFKVTVKIGDNISEQPFKPTARDVDAITDALQAITYTDAKSPAWLTAADGMPGPAELIIATNGIFSLGSNGAEKVCKPTPRLFAVNALGYEIHPKASKALQWLAFLEEIFEGDQEQIALLQQWFGYCLTADTRMQKMMLLIGPPRSGKGTIARVLSHVIGMSNICAPTLAGLGTNFGLWPLIEKTAAIISDARLSGRTDQAIVTERLLSITGEDTLTIDRKNQKLLTTKLSTRIMLLTNELPKLADASGALANRFLILSLRKSFLGNEDIGLTDRLITELPEIAGWAIEGLMQLRDEGRFSAPAAGDELRRELNDLASLVSAFVRDWCRIGAGETIPCGDLFDAWVLWCAEQGDHRPGTKPTFGRDLRAAFPAIGSRQPNRDGERIRMYVGIQLTLAAAQTLSTHRDELNHRRNRSESGANYV